MPSGDESDLETRFQRVTSYPVEDWHPKLCGQMDLIVKADGSWWHEGVAIGRQSLILLFGKLLRKDTDGYYLVTPVEKLKITVEDLPYLAVDFEETDSGIVFVTDHNERVILGEDHPLAFDGEDLKPRLYIRHNLWARITRSAWYRLVDRAELSGDTLQIGRQRFDLKSTTV